MFTTAILLVIATFIFLAYLMWAVHNMMDNKSEKDIEDRSNQNNI